MFFVPSSVFRLIANLVSLGDSTSLAGLKKQLSVSVPLSVLNEKLKEKDAAHALLVVDLQSAAEVSEERRLEIARLVEEVKRLQEAGGRSKARLKPFE